MNTNAVNTSAVNTSTVTRLVLAGGLVIDGTGSPGRVADVVIEDGVIASINPVGHSYEDAEVRDISGLTIAPGFIDSHSHADNAPFLARADVSKVLQGVTTEVVGNCGLGLAPRSPERATQVDTYMGRFFPELTWVGNSFGSFLEQADAAGYIVNYAPLVGHGAIRISAMGFEEREPTAAEISEMKSMLTEALDAGAIGMSTGLVYPPGRFAQTAELIELAGVLNEYSAIYASHTRSESSQRMAAVEEAITIGRESGARVQISHHKAMGEAHWGEVQDTLRLARQAREDGVDVRFDVYPYTASSTNLTSCLPPGLAGLADVELVQELAKPEVVAGLRADLDRGDWDNHVHQCGGFSGILISSTHDRRFEGKTLEELAEELGTDGAGALVHVLVEEQLRAMMVCFAMSEVDVEAALQDEFTSIGSDGVSPGFEGNPHPRKWGTFPRVLGRYVRERGVLTLEDAIYRMTGLPADTFRLPGVGKIQEGYSADLVVFDSSTIVDLATYAEPRLHAHGIREVMVGGVTVVADNAFTGQRPGRRLRSA